MTKPIAVGNIVRFFTGCPCGRAFEADQPHETIPEHVCNHRLVSGNNVHTCTGCTWEVQTYTPAHKPETIDAVNRAYATHLLTTALYEPE
ncbi:hypothetical protein [Paenarthrobacter ilicis]|uniref:hypothetical protein n=1 Tax=Paenarthrobacter ilicis TaxID=43665 RepID=UPI0028D352C3|nr:hypothetical protein [Paenarthrobacter ilicis]